MDLKKDVYVRCPILDREYLFDPRDFIVGRIVSIDEYAEQLTVRFFDPFGYRAYYDDIPQEHSYAFSMVNRCELQKGTRIKYKGKAGRIICVEGKDNDEYSYFVQLDLTKEVLTCSETTLEAPFSEGRVSPVVQLNKYEFQNPSWYLGRSVVNRVNKILDNSILGFKELAGCKIYLMPHQLNTIMRCNQEKNCRYMLADEVGMGKTIEASAVLKLFLLKNSRKSIAIVVPDALKEQWRVELFLKFDITQGTDVNNNTVNLLSFSDYVTGQDLVNYDFVVIDEVHRLLNDAEYERYHTLSQRADNILLLSATPLQRRTSDYLNLLRLLDPKKYDDYSDKEFAELVALQSKIITQIMGVIDDVDDLQDEINEHEEDEAYVRADKKCLDLFDDIVDGLEAVSELINDEAYNKLISDISSEDENLGISKMYIAISYVCDNYQIERCIIRNRRNILYRDDYASHTRPVRKLSGVITYQSRASEYAVYELLIEIIESESNLSVETLMNKYKPLLSSYFSSASAFSHELSVSSIAVSDQLSDAVSKWVSEEKYNASNIAELLDNPEDYEDRMLKVIDYLDQELYKEKVVIFTSFQETFDLYKDVLSQIYEEGKLAFFNGNMSSDELELNVYRFQNEKSCQILLCDKTGGEGRNFQVADYIIHLDLPWDANEIEQRIGRLDRLERDPQRPEVNSVVVISEESLEQQLFKFWNKGINVFEESLSGLEIVLEDINNQMFSAIASDIKYGLFNAVSNILETITQLKKEIKREQRFDTVGYLYKPINRQIARLLRYYSKNENELFSKTMLNWASLAGFKPSGNEEIVKFSAGEFRLNSARNTLLIPPDWTAYLQSRQMEFAAHVNELYSDYAAKGLGNGKEIKGTFNRKTAIDNDYLHFFAPGDAIFDCIVDNAIHSTKGQATAFAMQSEINWEGFIYTFSVEPNERLLLSNGISPSEIAYFRNFLTSDMAVVPVAFEKYQDIPREKVMSEYEKVIEIGFRAVHTCIDHLGRRGKKGGGFLHISQRVGVSNLEWFKNKFPEDLWKSYVEGSYAVGRKQALKDLSRNSHLRDAKEEVQRLIAAKVSSDTFFGREDESVDILQTKYDIILESLRTPTIVLESACYVWMVR